MSFFKNKHGITMVSLIVTVIVLSILTGVTIRAVTLDNSVMAEAKQVKKETDVKNLEDQVDLAIMQEESKNEKATLESVTNKLIQNGVITSESQVNTETGTITIGDYVLEEKLKRYVDYEGTSIRETDTKYFTFNLNASTKTATITGIQDDQAVKASCTKYGTTYEYNCAIKDKDTGSYITDIVIPGTVTVNEVEYTVTTIGEEAFGNWNAAYYRDSYGNNEYMFTSFILPNTITSIETDAFAGATKLASITIPDSVMIISSEAFYGCTSLNNVTIPNGVTIIGENAFDSCTSLNSINIPSSITRIENYTFYNCTGLQTVTMEDGVTSIGENAFDYCTSLSNINIPNSVTNIENCAFEWCMNISNFNIPNSVTTMGYNVFYDWTSSQTINCQVASMPSGWSGSWNNGCKANVNWNVDM